MRTASPFVYASVAALRSRVLRQHRPFSEPARISAEIPTPGGLIPGRARHGDPAVRADLQFTTTYGGKRGTGSAAGAVAWQSSDENVAVVRNGLVRGLSGGQTRIVAIWGGYQSTAVVNVIAPWKKHDNPPVCLKRTWRAGQLRMTQC